jgi:hypothetical protein
MVIEPDEAEWFTIWSEAVLYVPEFAECIVHIVFGDILTQIADEDLWLFSWSFSFSGRGSCR